MAVYQDPQERVEAALLVAAEVMVGFERDVYRRVAAEYRAVNNDVTEGANPRARAGRALRSTGGRGRPLAGADSQIPMR